LILVIGAAGKTGQAICQSLVNRNESVRALVRRGEQTARMLELGVQFIIVGDMADRGVLSQAFAGTSAVYLICPNMNPDELTIGERVIAAAKAGQVERFVYHSVLRPQIQAMPHHWQKLLVEEQLINSGLKMTILRPTVYMQNIIPYWETMMIEGTYAVPYSVESPISMVDLNDVAEVAAKVLIEDGHGMAEYELCAPEALSARQIAARVAAKTGREIQAQALGRADWETRMRANRMPPYALDTLLKMFQYYESNGFKGNSNVLAWLLGRPPRGLDDFLALQTQWA